ncbi:MAG TPA: ABC transporter permease [Chloroflexota bacterium]|nr:ABC transporter permease [Chloroflexota bacterium]
MAASDLAAATAPGFPLAARLWAPWLRRALFYVGLVAVWQLIASSGMWPSYVVPGPNAVTASLADGLAGGVFLVAAAVSLSRLAVGYVLSVGLGILLGMLIARFRLADELLGSLVLALQSLPSVCWLPLAILWFGLNQTAVIFVVVMGALFSITLGVASGVRNTPPLYVKAARNMGSHGWRLYSRVIIPAALPAVLSGLKQGWSFAWRSLMAGELIYFSLSLGNLLQTGRDLNDAARVVAVMVVIMVIGLVCDQLLFAPFERRMREKRGLN